MLCLQMVPTSTGGAITDAPNATVNVTGTTTMAASDTGAPANITLDNATNNFAGTVNASGADVTLSDANSLTLGTVTSTGKVSLKSKGALNLGNTTVSGALQADSGGGDITQSGPLIVQGLVTLDAGIGAVTLTDTGNSLTTGADIQATRYAIAGDARRDAAAAAALAQGAMPVIATATPLPSATSAPQPLVMSAAATPAVAAPSAAASSASSSSSASSEGGAVTGAGSTAGVIKNITPLGDGRWRLFNLRQDPGETQDLQSAEPEIFASMQVAYAKYAQDYGVLPVPEGFDLQKAGLYYAVHHYLLPKLREAWPLWLAIVGGVLGLAYWRRRRNSIS